MKKVPVKKVKVKKVKSVTIPEVTDLIKEADVERDKAQNYKDKYNGFLEALSLKLVTTPDEIQIIGEVEKLLGMEDKVIELQTQIEKDKKEYEAKIDEVTKRANELQKKLDTLNGDLLKLKEAKPEKPIEIQVQQRKRINFVIDLFQKFKDKLLTRK